MMKNKVVIIMGASSGIGLKTTFIGNVLPK